MQHLLLSQRHQKFPYPQRNGYNPFPMALGVALNNLPGCAAAGTADGQFTSTGYVPPLQSTQFPTPIINCPICSKKYRVCTEHHNCYKPGHGGWSSYYLVPFDYPEYSGIQEAAVYPRKNLSFAEALVENYTLEELERAQEVAEHCRGSTSLTGVAASICIAHRRAFHSVKIQSIRLQIATAILLYPNYSGTKEQRDIVRKQEEIERKIYEEEKSKYKVPIDL